MLSSRIATLIVALATASGCGRLNFDDEKPDARPPGPPPIALRVPQFTTTSPTFVDVAGGSLTIPSSEGTSWAIFVSAHLNSTAFDEIAVEARYLVDGVERGIGGTQMNATNRPGPWQHFYLHRGTDQPATITVQVRNAVGATSSLEELSVVAVALPAGADPQYATHDAIQEITTEPLAPLYDFTLQPRSAGDYLVFLLANTSDWPLEADIYTEWRDPDGTLWAQGIQMPRTPWQSHMHVRRTTIGPGPATIRLSADSPGGQIQNARVLAIRTDAFASVELANDFTEQTTRMPAVITVNELAPTSSGNQFLYLASSRVDSDCGPRLGPAERGNFFVVDGVTESLRHVTENCAYMTTYGAMRLLSSRPDALSIGFNAGNDEVVIYKESSILLVGLD